MDRKITELDSIEKIESNDYLVVASDKYDENYKINVLNFVDQLELIEVDSELSLTSTNPVQNKVITKKINEIDKQLEQLGNGGSGSGSGSDFDLVVSNVVTTTVESNQPANVTITDLGKNEENVKSLSFHFAIPKGKDGTNSTGPGGDTGIGSFGYRTVFAFKHHTSKPAKPVGGSWDVVNNTITYPEGWSSSDALEHPVYMSNATFSEKGIVGDWSDPICISSESSSGSGSGDGSDSKVQEFIYKTSDIEANKPNKPTNNPLVDDYVPREEGWDDHPQGVSITKQCEWICTRTYSEKLNQWNDWEGPALWSKYGVNGKDGDGVEYIYTLTTKYSQPYTPGTTAASNSPTANFQDREFIPAQTNNKGEKNEFPWTDNPNDVTLSIPYQWVSVRKFKWDTQVWGNFEEPVLWAKYGKDGDEAVAAFKSIVFRRTNNTLTSNDTPKGGSYSNPIPDEPVDKYGNRLWFDGIPDGNEKVWMSSRIFTAKGEFPQQDYWTAPKQMTDTASFDVEFSSKENPGLPIGHPNTNENWSNVSDSNTIWMATSTMANGEWSDWLVSRIKGEKGDAGTSVNILGSYDSLSALNLATADGKLPGNNPPMTGDCYLVNGILYVWDGDSWFNAGNIQGTPGTGIKSIVSTYQVHTSATSAPTGKWYPTSPATDNTYRYLWKKTVITYTNVSDEATDDTTFYEMIGTHGEKGVDGDSIEYIFCLTKTDDAPTVPTSNNPIDTNAVKGQWTDDALGPDSTWKYEWVTSHTKSWDESQQRMVWGPYTSPATHWAVYSEDGRGISEIIAQYARHSEGTETHTELEKLTWYDSSPSVNKDYPFLWKRTKIKFTDGDTSDAWQYEMIGKLGDKGIDGDSVEFVFKMTEERIAPSKPSAGEISTNVPGEWTDDPLTMDVYGNKSYKYQWVSQRVRVNEVWGEYSAPSIWSELYPGLYLHIKYSNDIENKLFTGPNGTGEDVGKYIGVYTDYNEGDSGDFDDYTWRKFEGDDGFGREYIFKLNNDYNDPPKVPIRQTGDNTAQFEPTGWDLNPITPNQDNKYCWCCHRDGNGDKWGDWTGNSTNTQYAYLFSMYAESVKGNTGDSGPILYPAGYWESGKTYKQILRDDDSVQATPYVYERTTEKYYYLLRPIVTSTTPPYNDTDNWEPMDTFNAIYTDILLANNAKVGQAVFNGDYIFSQLGVNPVTGRDGDFYNFGKDGDPYTANSTFDPNWCVNLKTGEQWGAVGSIYFGKNKYDSKINLTSQSDTAVTTTTLSSEGIQYAFKKGYNTGGFFVDEDALTYKTISATNDLITSFKVSSTGAGQLANASITWDANGNLKIKDGDAAAFDVTGSGRLAKGSITWDNNGNVTAQVFTPLYFADDTSTTFNLPAVPTDTAKNFSIPYFYSSRTAIQFTFRSDRSGDTITYVSKNGSVSEGTTSLSVNPSITEDMPGGIGVIDCFGKNGRWYLIERNNGSGTNIQFVQESNLPDTGTEGVLYVVI